MMKSGKIAACLGAAALAAAAPVKAQDLLALSWSETNVLGQACAEADIECSITILFDRFMTDLASRDWPLVAVEWYVDLEPAHKDRLLPALRDHIDRGGRLLLMYTNLDDWPELQELVDVRTRGDVTSVRSRRIWSVDPPHAVWAFSVSFPLIGDQDFWPDNGDFLDPGTNGYVLAAWDDTGGPPAMTLTRHGRIMTNGFDLDAFEGFALEIVTRQLPWLLACHADLDEDGELTLFDFLAFQNLFALGDPKGDFSFDGRFDFFDFLEFQSQFAIGCP